LAQNGENDNVDKACALYMYLKCSSVHLFHKTFQTRIIRLLLSVPIQSNLQSHVFVRFVLLCIQITRLHSLALPVPSVMTVTVTISMTMIINLHFHLEK
jgi:hypothetical protein